MPLATCLSVYAKFAISYLKLIFRNYHILILLKKMTMKKAVGRVTEDERDEIQSLFERRNGLN